MQHDQWKLIEDKLPTESLIELINHSRSFVSRSIVHHLKVQVHSSMSEKHTNWSKTSLLLKRDEILHTVDDLRYLQSKPKRLSTLPQRDESSASNFEDHTTNARRCN